MPETTTILPARLVKPRGWSEGVNTTLRLPSLAGLGALGVFVLGFVFWGGVAPIAGAIVSPGVLAAEGKNQIVQHLEGGIVKEILVHEGDRVKKGQPLLRLDPTDAQTQRARLTKQVVSLSARIARLEAIRDGKKTLTFPDSMKITAADIGMNSILAEQQAEFAADEKLHGQQSFILKHRLEALKQQIVGLQSQQTASQKQLDVVSDEASRQKALLEKGLTSRTQYTTLLQSEAGLIGQVGETKSSILSTLTQIEEAKEQLSQLDTKRIGDAVSQIDDLRVQLSDQQEQLQAATAVFERVVVRAPCDGVVVRLLVNATGGVIRPAEELAEILPTDRQLVVRAHIRPTDIEKVSVGQKATLRFSGLNNRTTPETSATVAYVSADRLVDDQTQQGYYIARLKLSKTMPRRLATSLALRPGMPVEAYINTGSRTFFSYLLQPIVDSFHRAFRES